MRRRGFTLVEMMITVACMGILVTLLGQLSTAMTDRAHEELQRARAGELLRALTRAESRGVALGERTRADLERGLPEVQVTRRAEGAAVTFVVEWRTPGGAHPRLALSTFAKGGAR